MDPALALALHKSMLRIRIVEERIAALYGEQEMRCPVHLCIGQEAACAGAAAALEPRDYAMSGHRSHGHYLAKGGSLRAMMAEIYGRATGCAGGKGGSMHLVDAAAGFLGAAPIVGSTIPIAVGAAFSAWLKGEDRVSMLFFGDGAAECGVLHESLNFAVLHRLPAVFVCENNLYSVYSPMEVRQPPDRPIAGIARAHGAAVFTGDGNDVEAAYALSRQAVDLARSGGGPAFVELSTYRWREHCGPNFDNDIGYRTEAEYQVWREQDPVERHRRRLIANGAATAESLDAMAAALSAEMEEAVVFARSSPFPAPETAALHVYAP